MSPRFARRPGGSGPSEAAEKRSGGSYPNHSRHRIEPALRMGRTAGAASPLEELVPAGHLRGDAAESRFSNDRRPCGANARDHRPQIRSDERSSTACCFQRSSFTPKTRSQTLMKSSSKSARPIATGETSLARGA